MPAIAILVGDYMTKTEIMNAMRDKAQSLDAYAVRLRSLRHKIATLPGTAEYVGFDEYPLEKYAMLSLYLAVDTFDDAILVSTVLPPAPQAIRTEPPHFIPRAAAASGDEPVQPVVYSYGIYLDPVGDPVSDQPRVICGNKLVWFWNPPGFAQSANVLVHVAVDQHGTAARAEDAPPGQLGFMMPVPKGRAMPQNHGTQTGALVYWKPADLAWQEAVRSYAANTCDAMAEDAQWPDLIH